MMLWIPKLFGIHVVATIHGLDWQRAKWGNFASKMLKQGEKTAARHADEIIGPFQKCAGIFSGNVSAAYGLYSQWNQQTTTPGS